MAQTDQPVAALVLPTYNERENLAGTCHRSFGVLPVADSHHRRRRQFAGRHGCSWPTSWPQQYTGVEVLHRAGKLGLGTAYAAGFARALADGFRPHLHDGCRLLA